MKFRIIFTGSNVRKTPIYSGYRPDWCCIDKKPDYNCGMLHFNGDPIMPDGEKECILTPLQAGLWENISVNDVLNCMEGSRCVGKAIVLEVLE